MTLRLSALAGLLLLAAAPSLRAAQPIAHYPLQADGNDALGLNTPMFLLNAPIQNGGVWCSGVYADVPSGYIVRTPPLPAMNLDSFTMSVEFLYDGIHGPDDFFRPIILCGHLSRSIGARIDPDSTLSFMYNNGHYVASAVKVLPGAWHTLTLSYEATSQTGSLTLDFQPVISQVFALEHGNQRDFDTTHSGTGMAFRGYVRNLVVYDAAFDPTPVLGTTWGGIKALFD